MKILPLILLLPALAFAGGPKSTFPEPRGLDAEMANIYHDIANPVINIGTASTMTVTFLNVSSITLNGVNLGGSSTVAPNILINGGFEFWQRATSFSAPAATIYLSDRWKVDTSEAANVTVTKETTVVDAVGLASMKVVVASAGASKYWVVQQFIENFADYRGKTVTASVRVNTSVATAVRVVLGDSATSASSSFHTGGGGWETLSVTLTVDPAATALAVTVGMTTAGDKKNGTYYFDNSMLTVGSSAMNFVSTDPAIDFGRCQRYYFKTFDVGTVPVQNSGTNIGALSYSVHTAGVFNDLAELTYPVRMRVVPTVTTYSIGAASADWWSISRGAASGVPVILSTNGTRSVDIRNPQVAADAVGQLESIHVTADAEM